MEPSPSGRSQVQGDAGVGGMRSASRFGVLGKPPRAEVSMNPSESTQRATCTMPSAARWSPRGQGHGPMAQGTAGTWGKRDGAGSPWGPTPHPRGTDKAQPWLQGPAAPSRRLCPSTDTGQRPGAGEGTAGSPLPPTSHHPGAEGLGTPRGSQAAIKVQLRFFAFGTMATFPSWLNYGAGCCLRGGGQGGSVCLLLLRARAAGQEPRGNHGLPQEPQRPCLTPKEHPHGATPLRG